MTVVSSQAYSGPYTPNGSTVAFPFTFPCQQTADVAVAQSSIAITTGFTITLNSDQTVNPGGTVTFVTAPATGSGSIVVYSAPDFGQNVAHASGVPWNAATVKAQNSANDRAALRDQVLKRDIARALSVPIGQTGLTLDPTGSADGMVLAFQGGSLVPAANSAAAAQVQANLAAASASAAATSAALASTNGTGAAASASAAAVSATSASSSAASASAQAAVAAAAALGLPYYPILNASTAASGGNVLPQGITSGTVGGTAVTGATPGSYPLTSTGGDFTGVTANLVVTSATAATIVIVNPGRTTVASPAAPTWTNPSGATLPAGTTLTANIGTQIASGTGQFYLTSNANGTALLYWQNTGTGAPIAVTDAAGNQLSIPLNALVSALLLSASSWQTPAQTLVAGQYIQASDGSIHTSASFSYAEYALTGVEVGFRINVDAYLTTTAYVTWYNAGGAVIGTPTAATALHVIYTNQVITPPVGAAKLRVCGYNATVTPQVQILTIAPNIASTIAANSTSVASVLVSLTTTFAPTQSVVTGEYIQASDGSIHTSASFGYVEYALTGAETAITITVDAYLTTTAYVAWYDSLGAFISGTAASASHVTYSGLAVTPPTRAAKMRVCGSTANFNPSFQITALLPSLAATTVSQSTTLLAQDASITTLRASTAGWQTPTQTLVSGKYIQYSDGSIQTSTSFSYVEYNLTGSEQGFQITVDSYLTTTAYVAWYNSLGVLISATQAGAGHTIYTNLAITAPNGATKLRVCGYNSTTPVIQTLDVLPSLGLIVQSLQSATALGSAPTGYAYDYVTGTAFANDALTTTDYMVIVDGTSWSIGYNQESGDAPVTTTAVSPGNALMFDVGVYPNGRAVAAYTDLLEQTYAGGKESPCSGIASAVLQRLNARIGVTPRLILTVGGKAGNAYAGGASGGTGNKRGSAAYVETLRLVGRAKAISAAAGRTLKVLAVVSLSGENELATYSTLTEQQFIDALRQWRMNLEDDCRRITGQKEPIPFVTYQTSWTDTQTFALMSPVQSAQRKIHDRDPLIFQTGPVYFVDENAGGGHTTAQWYRRVGRHLGAGLTEALLGPYHTPLQVIDAWWVSSTVFRLRYSEAVTLETTDTAITLSTLANPAGKGIEFDDGSGSPPTITGVTVQTSTLPRGGTVSDILEVTLSAAPTGLRKRAFIASRRQASQSLGRVAGGRSGIRSTAIFDTDTLDSYVLYKWAMAEMVVL
jgi:hypothetical protein